MSSIPAMATIYYVSPTGSDSNNGTSPVSPWGSVAKIDSTTFQPGDQILFKYGSTWNASLNATASGSATAPIVYGAYGNPTQGNPTFYGSNSIASSSFTPVAGTTYQTVYSTPVNWVYLNHVMANEAQDALAQAGSSNANTPSYDLSYVESTPNSFYYNSGNGQLFVNPGSGSLSQYAIGLGLRQDAIYNQGFSNLIFRNLNTAETAADNAGYGVRFQTGSNVTLMNSTVASAGKHNVGLINVTAATVTGVVANGSAPGQGFGGASGFVSYSDAVNGPTSVNTTSVYNNDSYTNSNGPYQAFISHGGTNGIASIALNNLNAVTGSGTSVVIYGSGASETVSINGGTVDGNIELDTNNSVINGTTLTGPAGKISLGGSNTVVQNTVLNGVESNPYAGNTAGIIDSGTNNTIRFNIINDPAGGPSVCSTSSTSNTKDYGNIAVDVSDPGNSMGFIELNFTNGQLTSNYNLYAPGVTFFSGGFNRNTFAQWQAMGYDLNTLVANVLFNNSGGGDFSLQSISPGLGLVPGTVAATNPLADSMLGGKYTNGNYNAGLNPFVSGILNSVSTEIVLNNGQMSVISPAGNTLSIRLGGSIFVLSNSSLDVAGNVNNAGIFAANGPLIQTGNFTNSGSVILSGPQTWSPGTVFTNTAGTASFTTDAGGSVAPVGYLQVNISGGAVSFGSSQHLAGLNVFAGGSAQLANQNGQTPILLVTPSLAVTGTLDISANDLIVQSGNLASITALVAQGYNGGQWNGFGITSTAGAADPKHLTAIGVILNSNNGTSALYGYNGYSAAALGLFDGTIPNSTDILVKYTYYGDSNLDGKVDGSDYSLLDNGFTHHLTGWYNGDYNYDGVVNGSDYTLIDNAYNEQGGSLAASIAPSITASITPSVTPSVTPDAAVTTQIAAPANSSNASVPEPTALVIFGFTSLATLRRRRCHQNP